MKVQVFLGLVVLATAHSIPINPFFGGLTGFGGDYMVDDIDRDILKDLVRLDVVNRHLVRKFLVLDVVDRKVVGDLARGINDVIIKKGKLYPLTLWDRVLKIKGDDTVISRGIETNWVGTEIEDKEILRDLIKVDTVDRDMVISLLHTDAVDRKIIADLADVINEITIKKGRQYPLYLLDKVTKINGGITTGFGLDRFDFGRFGYDKIGGVFGRNRFDTVFGLNKYNTLYGGLNKYDTIWGLNKIGYGGYGDYGYGCKTLGLGCRGLGYDTYGLGLGTGLGFNRRGLYDTFGLNRLYGF